MAERVRAGRSPTTRATGCCGSCAAVRAPAVTWRRARMVLPSAQGMDVAMTAQVTFTSAARCGLAIWTADASTSLSTGMSRAEVGCGDVVTVVPVAC